MKDEIIARLSIKGLPEMNKRQVTSFKKWLRKTADELCEEQDMKIFAKNFRATLYK